MNATTHHAVIPDEKGRLAALRDYQILDTPSDGSFDRITDLVATLMNVPVAIVSLVDHDRIWFKSHHGTEVEQVDRDPGLCASAIMGDSFYEITDAAVDPRTLSNPLVAGDFGVRFYAGHPLRTADGHNLGVLCALDFKPRAVTDWDRKILRTMAEVVMDQMNLRLAARQIHDLNRNLEILSEELRHQAMHDSLTGLWNRGAITAFLTQALYRSRRSKKPVTALMIDVDLFKSVNDTFGHFVGDEVLIELARRLNRCLRASDAVGRLGGEEFLVVLDEAGAKDALVVANRILHAISSVPFEVTGDAKTPSLPVTVSVGSFSTDDDLDIEPTAVVTRADQAMYRAKQQGRNQVVADH